MDKANIDIPVKITIIAAIVITVVVWFVSREHIDTEHEVENTPPAVEAEFCTAVEHATSAYSALSQRWSEAG